MKTKPAPKPKRGRPRTNPAGTIPASVKLTPAEREHLTSTYGSVNAGVRVLVGRDMSQK